MSYIVTEAVSGTAFRSITLGDGSKLPQSCPTSADGVVYSTTNPMPITQVGFASVSFATGSVVGLSAGSAAIGSVIVSQLPPLPTGSNVIGTVGVTGTVTVTNAAASRTALKDATGADITALNPVPTARYRVDGAGNAIVVKYAKIDCAAAGSNTLVTAVTGKRIRVLTYALMVAGSVTGAFQSNTTPISGAFPFSANGGLVSGSAEDGVMQTASGEALNLVLSAAVQSSGHLSYIEV